MSATLTSTPAPSLSGRNGEWQGLRSTPPLPSLVGKGPGLRSPRILMVTPRYYPLVGGTETHVAEVARRLVGRHGQRVTVLTTDLHGALPPLERGPEGAWVRRLRAYPAGGALAELRYTPQLGATILRERAGYDLLHLQGSFTLVAPAALRAARRAGLPYVVTFHSGGHSSRLRNLLRGAQFAALRPFLAGARRLIAVSRFEAAYFQARLRLPADRFTVVPNGVNLPDVATTADDGPAAGTLLVSTGRLERFKGHQQAIAALPHVLRSRPDACLRIVGSGPYEPELRRLAADLGVAGRVEIAAIAPEDRGGMTRLLRRAALVIAFSEYESQGIGVGEALALGRKALVTDATAFGELVAAGLAHGLPPQSGPQATASAILAALDTPFPAPGSISLPTWDDCAGQLAALYREILHVLALSSALSADTRAWPTAA